MKERYIMTGLLLLISGVCLGGSIYAAFQARLLKKTEEERRLLTHLLENTKDLIYHYQLKPERKFLYLSPSAETFFGTGTLERGYNDPDSLFHNIHPDDLDVMKRKITGRIDFNKPIVQRWRDQDGQYRWFEDSAVPVYRNGQLAAIQGVIRDVSEKMELQQELTCRIYHDPLTGIYNREFFEEAFEAADEKEAPLGLILCDLDDLKRINDTYGHRQGDRLIQEAAVLLSQFADRHTMAARIGGDEFILVAEGRSRAEITALAENIRKAADRHNLQSRIKVHLSIGASWKPSSRSEMKQLFAEADQRMYQNKRKRKSLQTVR